MALAARQGDPTSHGGIISQGYPQVLIEGQPAARVGDVHTCPMMNPTTPPTPHVGGPILPPGAPTVLIGGQPAARVGDWAVCAGPLDVILMGAKRTEIGGPAPPAPPPPSVSTPGAKGGKSDVWFYPVHWLAAANVVAALNVALLAGFVVAVGAVVAAEVVKMRDVQPRPELNRPLPGRKPGLGDTDVAFPDEGVQDDAPVYFL